ncbi:hypothetical protein LWI29_017740 [Acer saccharum]|uniref:Acid phosphatase/vanadium-dependent haloperoxidase-related protein n=1 Tax=Acer saccharum TaxID=4024 RepID=A0AA39VL41_ACESA|nr:hypothetical protein LWI29_017740 [Acer saccharum]KAK1568535.1 hypothetical protein Q3G72_025620 [Acer saccharum]
MPNEETKDDGERGVVTEIPITTKISDSRNEEVQQEVVLEEPISIAQERLMRVSKPPQRYGWDDENDEQGGGEFDIAVVIDVAFAPEQSPSDLRVSRLRYRSVPQGLHHLMLRYKERRWDSKRMVDSGGMPSSHSATVTALMVAIGLQEGTGGSAFAISVVLACIVMYDASGVRLHAGRQAELLNQIVCEFPPEHPLSNVRPLRELLGHTPVQVIAGAILGCIVGYLMRDTE